MSPQVNLPLVAGIVVVLALMVRFATLPNVPEALKTDTIASTTPAVVATSSPVIQIPKKKPLPPEVPFVLPEGATAIDDYAFIASGAVHFRSFTGKAPLVIPNSDAESFKRLSNIMTYPDTRVVGDCGAAPLYAYYGDRKQVYFYQLWRAPEFRSSTIEVVVGATMENFKITGALTATDGGRLFEVGYEKATTTCKLVLARSSR